jgi:hypothetical protein
LQNKTQFHLLNQSTYPVTHQAAGLGDYLNLAKPFFNVPENTNMSPTTSVKVSLDTGRNAGYPGILLGQPIQLT